MGAWMDRETARCQLSDRRLGRRLRKVLENLSKKAGDYRGAVPDTRRVRNYFAAPGIPAAQLGTLWSGQSRKCAPLA